MTTRAWRTGVATTAALVLAAGVPELAYATQEGAPANAEQAPRSTGGQLPDGWRISGTGPERELVWTASKPVPIGDSRVEFHAGDVRLGVPVASKDQRTFRLPLGAAQVGAGDDLKVLASGRRLDEAGQRAEARRRSAAPEQRAANAPLAPANPVDPGVKGRYQTTSGEYSLSSVKLPDFPAKVEMKATVVGPKNATGPRPLALFLHGRHATCYNATGEDNIDWPCPSGFQQIPSYKGYLHDQKLLASQGYVTVSISANGVNGQDNNVEDAGAQARSSLVRQHLARWAGWAKDPATAPAAVKRLPKANLDKVLLVGHSRGGEGVNRAALDTLHKAPAAADGYRGPVRWKIRGTVLIGPTIFGHNPAPDVPSLTLLPGCDGDVSDLQGQIYADGTRGTSRGKALHSSAYVIGANHNYFNTEWTPGQAVAPANDDWDEGNVDAVCSVGTAARLKPAQQQKAGSTYIAAAARLFVAGDDKVRPLLDGSHRSAPSAGQARVLTHAVGAHRKPAILPTTSTKVTGGKVCNQVDRNEAKSCLPEESVFRSPHFAWWTVPSEPDRHAVTAKWSRTGSPVKVTPSRPFSVKGSDALALRVIVPPNTTGTKLDVRVTDTNGRRADLGRVTVDGLPGTRMTTSGWAREVRVPLKAAVRAGLDQSKLKSLELVPRTTKGELLLMDAWGWRPGTPAPDPAKNMPRIDLGTLTVKEGDSGTRTVRLPVSVSGQGTGKVRVFVVSPGQGVKHRTVTVKPGSQGVDVPFTVKGDKLFGESEWNYVYAKAVRGAVVGATDGSLTVQNDDPMPEVTVTPVADDVAEGKPLTWRVALSAATESDFYLANLRILPVTSGAELSTKDVDPTWLLDQLGIEPNPELALSRVYPEPYHPWLWLNVPQGERSALVSVPTLADTVSEGTEHLRLQLAVSDEESGDVQYGPEFTGTVRDTA
ncbi:hypothetical protein [Streptomyces sp. NPDC005955]|uniref:hypothetical protein n=1 Tax=Streptomyces sp. NPDC005955 TaxID=3364738 RepID=UPI0036C19993